MPDNPTPPTKKPFKVKKIAVIFGTRPAVASPPRARSALRLFFGNQMMFALNVVRNLVLIPIYLRYIDDATLGAWLALTGAVAFLWLADFGINSLIVQRVGRSLGAKAWRDLGQTAVSGLVAVTVFAAAIFAVANLLMVWVPSWLGVAVGVQNSFLWAGRLAVLDAVLMLVAMTMAAILFGLQRPEGHVLAMSVGEIAGIGLTIGLLVNGKGLLAIPLGMLCKTLLTLGTNAGILLWVIRKALPPGVASFSVDALRSLLRSSGWLFLARLSRICTSRSTGLIVAIVISAPAVVILEVTRKASLVLTDAVGRIPASLLPGLSHLGGAGEMEKFRMYALRQLRITGKLGLLGAVLLLVLNPYFVELWTAQRYFGGMLLNVMIGTYALLKLIDAAIYNVILAAGEIRTVTVAATAEAGLQIVLSVGLGFAWGLDGILVAGILASVVSVAVQLRKFAETLQIHHIWRHISTKFGNVVGGPVLTGLALLLLVRKYPPHGWVSFALITFGFCIVGGGLLLVSDEDLRTLLTRPIRKRFGRTGGLLSHDPASM